MCDKRVTKRNRLGYSPSYQALCNPQLFASIVFTASFENMNKRIDVKNVFFIYFAETFMKAKCIELLAEA